MGSPGTLLSPSGRVTNLKCFFYARTLKFPKEALGWQGCSKCALLFQKLSEGWSRPTEPLQTPTWRGSLPRSLRCLLIIRIVAGRVCFGTCSFERLLQIIKVSSTCQRKFASRILIHEIESGCSEQLSVIDGGFLKGKAASRATGVAACL